MPEPSGDTATDLRPTDGLDASDRDLDFACAVALDSFSGPLDLLLFLVRRAEVDVVDIPIARIADQFIATVASWQDLDLELAGDFILMAASLLEIKARLIAPPPEEPAQEGEGDGEEEAVDLRAELVSKLLAYRRFKEAALDLFEREQDHAHRITRQLREDIPEDPEEAEGIDLENADPYLLHATWDLVMKRITGLGPRTVVGDPVPLEAVFADLIDTMRARGQDRLSHLFAAHPSKLGRVTTFMAVLECARQRFLEVLQHGQYEDADLRFRAEDERPVRVIEFAPEPPPPRRQKRPPLITVATRAGAEAAGDTEDEVDEAPTETDEQRFMRELEEACAVDSVLERTADVEQGFARYWAEKRGLPWPPPPPVAPPAPEPVAVAPAAPPVERVQRPRRQPKPPTETPVAGSPEAPTATPVAEAATPAEQPVPLLLLPAPVPAAVEPTPAPVVEAAPVIAAIEPSTPPPIDQPAAIAPATEPPVEPTPVTTAVLPEPAAVEVAPAVAEPMPVPIEAEVPAEPTVVAAAPADTEPEVVEPTMPEATGIPAVPAHSERLVVIIPDMEPTPLTLAVSRPPDVVTAVAQERFEPTPVTISIPQVLPEPPVEPELKREVIEEPAIPASALVVVAALPSPPVPQPSARAPLAAEPEPEPVVTPAKARTRQTTLDRPFRERLGPRRQHTLALSATLLVLAAGCWFAYHASTSHHQDESPPATADQTPPQVDIAGPAAIGPGPAPLAAPSAAAFADRLLDASVCADLAGWLGVALGDAEKPKGIDTTAGIAFGPLPEEPAPAPQPAAVQAPPEPEVARPLALPPPPAPPAPGVALWLDRLLSADDLATFVARLGEGVPVPPPAPPALPAVVPDEPPQRAFTYQREPMMSSSAWLVIWAWNEPPVTP